MTATNALTQQELKRTTASSLSRQLASICKAAAEPLRLDILRVLSNDSFGVQELAAIFAMAQPGMSHHLKVLAKAGLVVTRREANSIFYRLRLLRGDSEFYPFVSQLFETARSLPLSEIHSARIQGIYDDRSLQSQLYFERHADKFEENQGLLCELDQYLPNIREILDLIELPRDSRVMEVGPGQGELLRELAKRFDHLIALDSSEGMLAMARNKLSIKQRVTFVKSSLAAYDPSGVELDGVVLNMVLHHLPSPLQAFQKLRQVLRRGGYLLIADLCSHNQAWTQSSCGDIWLGFDPQDLRDWASSAGLGEEQSLYLGLKNGFQIQLKLFRAI